MQYAFYNRIVQRDMQLAVDLRMHIKHFEMQSDIFQTTTLNLVLILYGEISMHKYKHLFYAIGYVTPE